MTDSTNTETELIDLNKLSAEELKELALIGFKHRVKAKQSSKVRYDKQRESVSLRRKIRTLEKRVAICNTRKEKLLKEWTEFEKRRKEEIMKRRLEKEKAKTPSPITNSDAEQEDWKSLC